MLSTCRLWLLVLAELLEVDDGVVDAGDDDAAAVGLAAAAAAVSSGSGTNGSRVLSAITTAGVGTAFTLGEGEAFGAAEVDDEVVGTGAVALLSLEPLFFKTRK
jgi:hypothetical protein